jgi:hypothetical protein
MGRSVNAETASSSVTVFVNSRVSLPGSVAGSPFLNDVLPVQVADILENFAERM